MPEVNMSLFILKNVIDDNSDIIIKRWKEYFEK